jgi:aminomethyltransferase
MVPFTGYYMPIQYPSGIIKEHLHCRSQAGFFDISHMGQCLVSGDNMAEQLDKLTPTNIKNLLSGQQRYTVLTHPDGGIIDDIIITRLENDFMIVVNAACKEKDFAHLQSKLSNPLRVLSEQALFALQGPAAKSIMSQLSAPACHLYFMQAMTTHIKDIECTISRSGYCGEDGFEISVANEHARELADLILSFPQVQPIGLGARDTLRLEAGLSLYGHELNDDISPVEAGLKWLIDKNKQNYPGAEKIHQQLQQGAPRKRIGLTIEGKIPVREHHEIYTENGHQIGIITSGSFSPSLNKPIAIGLIDQQCSDKTLYANIRNRKIAMQLTSLPFVPHRYHRG